MMRKGQNLINYFLKEFENRNMSFEACATSCMNRLYYMDDKEFDELIKKVPNLEL